MCEILILKQTKKKTSKCRAERQTIIGLNVEKKKQRPTNFDNTLTNHGSTTLAGRRAGCCLCACVCYLERETTWPFAHYIHVLFTMVWRLFFFFRGKCKHFTAASTTTMHRGTRRHAHISVQPPRERYFATTSAAAVQDTRTNDTPSGTRYGRGTREI